jgi:hypothetical protein
MAFFAHIGALNAPVGGYTVSAISALNTVLDNIVADVAAAVTAGTNNGWTLHDDQRNGSAPNTSTLWAIPANNNVHGFTGQGYPNGYVVAAGATSMTHNSYSAPSGWGMNRKWVANQTKVLLGNSSNSPWTVVGTTTHTVTAIPNDYTATLGTGWSYTALASTSDGTQNNSSVMELAQGYIILKCTSTQKTFYVAIIRPISTGDGLRCQVFETWDNTTHIGTGCSYQEILRAYTSPTALTAPLQYMLWLLPDAFGLWINGDVSIAPLYGNCWISDFYYAGNLTPYRAGETSCLIAACTNTEQSMLVAVGSLTSAGSTGTTGGSAFSASYREVTKATIQIFGNLYPGINNKWVMQRFHSADPYTHSLLVANGITYLDITLPLFDELGLLQLQQFDVYDIPNATYSRIGQTGKRGTVKYLRTPVGNPSGYGLYSFGPGDDGHAYIMFYGGLAYSAIAWAGQPGSVNGATANPGDQYAMTAFAQNSQGGTRMGYWRYFLMPIDI